MAFQVECFHFGIRYRAVRNVGASLEERLDFQDRGGRCGGPFFLFARGTCRAAFNSSDKAALTPVDEVAIDRLQGREVVWQQAPGTPLGWKVEVNTALTGPLGSTQAIRWNVGPDPAYAAGVISTGTAASCTEPVAEAPSQDRTRQLLAVSYIFNARRKHTMSEQGRSL